MSYPETPTFWMEPTGQSARGMRRYVGCSGNERCEGDRTHSAIRWVDRVPTNFKEDLDGTVFRRDVAQLDPNSPDWPTQCEHCGYEFTDMDPKQTFDLEIFRRADTGQEHVLPGYVSYPPDLQPAPPGAMYHAYWLRSLWRGPDGIALSVVLPNQHVWHVDSRASNCTRPTEPHKCWIRHGDPRTGPITVDKNGDTCAAGAGSILAGDYHGFLTEGHLTAG